MSRNIKPNSFKGQNFCSYGEDAEQHYQCSVPYSPSSEATSSMPYSASSGTSSSLGVPPHDHFYCHFPSAPCTGSLLSELFRTRASPYWRCSTCTMHGSPSPPTENRDGEAIVQPASLVALRSRRGVQDERTFEVFLTPPLQCMSFQALAWGSQRRFMTRSIVQKLGLYPL